MFLQMTFIIPIMLCFLHGSVKAKALEDANYSVCQRYFTKILISHLTICWKKYSSSVFIIIHLVIKLFLSKSLHVVNILLPKFYVNKYPFSFLSYWRRFILTNFIKQKVCKSLQLSSGVWMTPVQALTDPGYLLPVSKRKSDAFIL